MIGVILRDVAATRKSIAPEINPYEARYAACEAEKVCSAKPASCRLPQPMSPRNAMNRPPPSKPQNSRSLPPVPEITNPMDRMANRADTVYTTSAKRFRPEDSGGRSAKAKAPTTQHTRATAASTRGSHRVCIPPALETCTDPSRGVCRYNLSKRPVSNPCGFWGVAASFVTGITASREQVGITPITSPSLVFPTIRQGCREPVAGNRCKHPDEVRVDRSGGGPVPSGSRVTARHWVRCSDEEEICSTNPPLCGKHWRYSRPIPARRPSSAVLT